MQWQINAGLSGRIVRSGPWTHTWAQQVSLSVAHSLPWRLAAAKLLSPWPLETTHAAQVQSCSCARDSFSALFLPVVRWLTGSRSSDIDNCLYSRSARVHDLMVDLIDHYFIQHLDLPVEEAIRLHKDYYTNYGLAIEGLVRHHQIDPLDYNAKVDDALPLEDIIKPDPELRKLLEDVDKSKVKMWLLTNAYVTHGKRVVRFLGVDDLFDGITFCDYAEQPLICKPDAEMYRKAMRQAGAENVHDCFFVDDNYSNCVQAQAFGWKTAHLVEDDLTLPKTPASQYQIRHLRELREIFPQFFKSVSM